LIGAVEELEGAVKKKPSSVELLLLIPRLRLGSRELELNNCLEGGLLSSLEEIDGG